MLSLRPIRRLARSPCIQNATNLSLHMYSEYFISLYRHYLEGAMGMHNINTSPLNDSTERCQTPFEELLNSITHGLGALLSMIGLVFLVAYANRFEDNFKVISVSIYGASLVLLYLASTFYHGISQPDLKAKFSLFDHCAIYLLIAGSYTPFLLVTLKGPVGWTLFGIVWGMAIAGISLKVIFKERLKIFRVATYVVMGWLVVFAGKTLIERLDTGGLILLAVGGSIYTLGVIFYIRDHILFNHAIWHLFVLGGSLCHYFAIYYYVLPDTPLVT